jgi:predicted glycogen debranching enzyme
MKLPAINLDEKELSHFEEAIQKEWLLTNGLGGYASSTVLSVNTRKYHGLLVAALNPPGNRIVCLSKLDEDVIVGESIFRLGTNEFRDVLFPRGYFFLKEFSVTPFPRYVYSVEGVKVEKTVFMLQGKNAVAIIYKLENKSGKEAKVHVYPLLTCRHFHTVLDRQANPLTFGQHRVGKGVEMTCVNPETTIIVNSTEGEFVEKPNWVDRLLYREEAKRGESSLDDCYQPGYFQISIPPEQRNEFAAVAAADKNSQSCQATLESIGKSTDGIKSLLATELKRRKRSLASFRDSNRRVAFDDWLSLVLSAADTFVVRGGEKARSIIAGYHWFESWGRDTFISLPGLLLATGRFTDAELVLLHFGRQLKKGLIPNFSPDKSEEPAYNTVDATLWYINAVLQYVKYTADFRFVEENLWQILQSIIENHEKGTDFGIHVDNDGLLAHGSRLTWMDAEVGGKAVTPRAGKAVEIQALWYNALKTVQLLAGRFGRKSVSWHCSDMASKALDNFNRKFWNRDKCCLFDVVEPSGGDASLRPNQIIAAALDFPILYRNKTELIVDVVQREFLKPCGLRTLAKSDPKYCGKYDGNRTNRDEAYHNGTVWPWLLGPFTTAFIRAKGNEPFWREFALKKIMIPMFSRQTLQAGLGTISEIFDGDEPHTPRGCISQAWSVAEPMRAYVEDVLQVGPRFEKEVLQLRL